MCSTALRARPECPCMSEVLEPPGLLDRALRRVTSLWRDMAERVVGAEADEGIEAQMRACLDGRGGEVSARSRAARLAQTYLTLDAAGRRDFLGALARFDSDDAAVESAIGRLHAATDAAPPAPPQSP